MYSPAAPIARIKPHSNIKISDESSARSVTGLESDINKKKYLISPYRLLAGIGIVLTGIAVATLYLSRGVT